MNARKFFKGRVRDRLAILAEKLAELKKENASLEARLKEIRNEA